MPRSSQIRPVFEVMRMASRLRLAEPELLGLKALIRAGDHVFDIGAAYGMYTFPLAHLVGPGGSVHSFEPQLEHHRWLKLALRFLRTRHVSVNLAALGATPGEHPLVLPVRFGIPIRGHAHIGRDRGNGHSRIVGSRQRMTSVHTVDSWCHLHGVEEVSFIKADVEGFEPEVLEGAAATIDRSRPSMLLEVEDRHIGRYGRDANQFVTDVRRRWPDYAMYTWCDDSWKLTDRVDVDKRNYLFATDAAFNRI